MTKLQSASKNGAASGATIEALLDEDMATTHQSEQVLSDLLQAMRRNNDYKIMNLSAKLASIVRQALVNKNTHCLLALTHACERIEQGHQRKWVLEILNEATQTIPSLSRERTSSGYVAKRHSLCAIPVLLDMAERGIIRERIRFTKDQVNDLERLLHSTGMVPSCVPVVMQPYLFEYDELPLNDLIMVQTLAKVCHLNGLKPDPDHKPRYLGDSLSPVDPDTRLGYVLFMMGDDVNLTDSTNFVDDVEHKHFDAQTWMQESAQVMTAAAQRFGDVIGAEPQGINGYLDAMRQGLAQLYFGEVVSFVMSVSKHHNLQTRAITLLASISQDQDNALWVQFSCFSTLNGKMLGWIRANIQSRHVLDEILVDASSGPLQVYQILEAEGRAPEEIEPMGTSIVLH